ncbi:hypothetical protein IV500_04985 [Paeniglutamicibacter antarcticus]|uniref:Uncharacterized protein n=1 Tax=Arthrobacter terrae TaxID=2935737 RepID=A0A931CS87_9MICC|nr:hypothetical protein [Arthrobacter terrae]MBG0738773.1 hypothetical protein [Arthrobacter terrae]
MRVITTVDELEALPTMSVIGCVSAVCNIPLVVVFQRGSLETGGSGWCAPEAQGQITSHQVFQFLLVNQLPYELTVFWEPGL